MQPQQNLVTKQKALQPSIRNFLKEKPQNISEFVSIDRMGQAESTQAAKEPKKEGALRNIV